jgi:predicted CopG family antitoxin
MADKTLAVDREAYALLAKAKHQGETFSDVVKRSVRPRRLLTDFAGTWEDMDPKEWARIRATIIEGRRLDTERQKRVLSRWK